MRFENSRWCETPEQSMTVSMSANTRPLCRTTGSWLYPFYHHHNMLYNEYKTQWIGKKVDFDNAYWYQCVDLARHYHKAMFGTDMWPFWWTAWTWWQKFKVSPQFFSTIRVEKYQIPPVWAIVFFSPQSIGNIEWHVAIVDYCQIWGDKIDVLGQNALGWGGGTWWNAIRVGTYDLSKIAWWVIPK